MKVVRLELRNDHDKTAFGRTMSYGENVEFGDIVRIFFSLVPKNIDTAKLNLRVIER